eukprot:2992188-Ditylum_brightwellii.AAC.2
MPSPENLMCSRFNRNWPVFSLGYGMGHVVEVRLNFLDGILICFNFRAGLRHGRREVCSTVGDAISELILFAIIVPVVVKIDRWDSLGFNLQ